ncbi:MAG: DUF4440 domain-containing protein [Calditrichaeota bacterium]|nr:MAG: DUF4440 domain-containing protein [Calditrichota bacterium]
MNNLEVIRQGYKLFSEGNVAGVLQLFQPDIVWDECKSFPFNENDGLYKGTDSVAKNVFAMLPRYYNDFRIEIDDLIGSGDKVVMVGHYVGTWKETGKSFRANATHVWTLKEGKASHFFQAVDPAEIMGN